MSAAECDNGVCTHRMWARCPGCNEELYAPGVWSFSHGKGACGRCGTRIQVAASSTATTETPEEEG